VLLLVLTAIVSMILGMGMPTTAVYVLLAVLVAPGLAKLGILPIAAHLFIFYFGMLSMITPPVCIASYAAASIGKTDPIKTGWEAMRLCSIAYVVPFLFVFSPSLLLIGYWYEVAASVTTAVFGAILLGVGLVGYLFRPIGRIKRILFVLAAAGLLIPIVHTGEFAVLTWASNGIGLALALALVCVEWLRRSARAETPTAVDGAAEFNDGYRSYRVANRELSMGMTNSFRTKPTEPASANLTLSQSPLVSRTARRVSPSTS
jgi:TRAP-type uncharacterized transport system fused permease subunit